MYTDLPAYILLTKVSGDCTPIISDTGDTSSFAATLGSKAFPNAEAPDMICVKLDFFCISTISGAKLSGVNPLKASLSATKIFDKPDAFAIASVAYNFNM